MSHAPIEHLQAEAEALRARIAALAETGNLDACMAQHYLCCAIDALHGAAETQQAEAEEASA